MLTPAGAELPSHKPAAAVACIQKRNATTMSCKSRYTVHDVAAVTSKDASPDVLRQKLRQAHNHISDTIAVNCSIT
jgi:cupin superfamily acireductone dioxygenase involved in methionine salvage